MLPLLTIQKAIEQAQQASATLSALMNGPAEPGLQEVQTCLLAGAQAGWLTQKGTPSATPNALAMAVGKGWVETARVLIAHFGRLAPQRGRSMFGVALGEGTDPNPKVFAAMVDLLMAANYPLLDPAEAKNYTLCRAFHHGLAFARPLLDAGALQSLQEPVSFLAVLASALSQKGGLTLLLQHATKKEELALAQVWWGAHNNRQDRPDLDDYAREGLRLSPPDLEESRKITKDNPTLRAQIAYQGLPLPEKLPKEDWDAEDIGFFWQVFSDQICDLLKQPAPVPGLDLSTVDDTGCNWLMARVKADEIDPENYDARRGSSYKFRAVMPQAMAAGLDPACRDLDGKTLGWHIISELAKLNEGDRRANTEGWLELVRNFNLWSYPILVSAQEVSLIEDPSLNMKSALTALGVWDEAVSAIENAQLASTTPVSSGPRSPVRM